MAGQLVGQLPQLPVDLDDAALALGLSLYLLFEVFRLVVEPVDDKQLRTFLYLVDELVAALAVPGV